MSKVGKILKILLIICMIISIPIAVAIPFLLKGFIFSKFIIYPNSIIMLLITIQFIKLFNSLEEDNPFTIENVNTLKRGSIYSFIMSVLWLIDIFYLLFIKKCTYINYFVVIAFFIILFFGVGVALYILSKLFYKATNYREDSDLTI